MRRITLTLVVLSLVFSFSAVSGQGNRNRNNKHGNNSKIKKPNSAQMKSGIRRDNNKNTNNNNKGNRSSSTSRSTSQSTSRSGNNYDNYRRNRQRDVQALYNEVDMPDPWVMREKLANSGNTATDLPRTRLSSAYRIELDGKVARKTVPNGEGAPENVFFLVCDDGTPVKLPPPVSVTPADDADGEGEAEVPIDYLQYLGKAVTLRGYGSRTLGEGGKLKVSLSRVMAISAASGSDR